MLRVIALAAILLLAGCGPKDQEDCAARAAKDARSVAAMRVLTNDCETEFPAQRQDDGSYAYYVGELDKWVPVSGPKLSAADNDNIRNLRAKAQKDKEQEAAEDQKAQDRENKEIADVLTKTKVSEYNVSCNIDDTFIKCYDKNITVKIVNSSDKTISGITVMYEIGQNIDCKGSLSKSFDNTISIPPGGTGTIVQNVTFKDAGPEGVMNGCVRIGGINAIQ